MPALSPIYTGDNCHPAYQLNWSLSVFWHQPPSAAQWLEALQAATEPDGARVLEHRFVEDRMSQFLVSTKPAVSPHALVRSVKGRLAARAMIVGVCGKQGYLLSHAGIVSDHVHITLGGVPNQSPGEIVVRFMNNLAYREGMKQVFEFGYYVGTFGEYDLGAIPRL